MRRSWYEEQGTAKSKTLDPVAPATRRLPVARALIGWPEGSIYRPRAPVFFDEVIRAEAAEFMKERAAK